jgi:hypothetical protein
MRPHDYPTAFSADEQLRQLAAFLATGLRRLSRQSLPLAATSAPQEPSENPAESGRDCLELCGKTRLSVHNG